MRFWRSWTSTASSNGELVDPSLPVVLRRLERVHRLSAHDQLTLAFLLVRLMIIEVGLRSLPISRLSRWFGVPLRLSPERSTAPPNLPLTLTIAERRQLALLRRVLPRWRSGRGLCLRQSLMLGHILRRHGAALRIGVNRRGDEVLAHAWVEVGGRPLGADTGFLPLGMMAGPAP